MVLRLDMTLMDVPSRKGERVAWADIAKAFSMILLVAYTLYGDRIHVNELLTYLRMPLFFFVSGLFGYRVVTATSFRELMRDKVTNFVYLYVLWELMRFVFLIVVSNITRGYPELDFGQYLTMLWDPVFNIWFLYALALAFLIAWCVRKAPAFAVLAVALVLYAASFWINDFSDRPFLEQLVRLFPFFWMGLMGRPLVFALVEARWKLWPLVLAAFFAAAYASFGTIWSHIGLVTVAISLTGILGFLFLARHVSTVETFAAPLRYIGASTLYVYVLHKILIFYTELFLDKTGLHFAGEELVQLALVVPLAAFVGRMLDAQPGLGWLFTAPWVEKRRPPEPASAKPMLVE